MFHFSGFTLTLHYSFHSYMFLKLCTTCIWNYKIYKDNILKFTDCITWNSFKLQNRNEIFCLCWSFDTIQTKYYNYFFFFLLENVVGVSTFLLHGLRLINLLFQREKYSENNYWVAVVAEILPPCSSQTALTHLLIPAAKMLCLQTSNEDRNKPGFSNLMLQSWKLAWKAYREAQSSSFLTPFCVEVIK